MPENAAAEGGFGRDAPSRPDDNDRGGAREEKERAEKAESFERAMDNANRPDRAPAAPSETVAGSGDDDDDHNSTDKPDDRPDRAAGPPGIGAPPESSTPADNDNKTDDDDDRSVFDRAGDFFGGLAKDMQDFARDNPRVDSHGNTVGLVDADGIQRGEVASRVRSSGTSAEGLASQLGFASPQDMAGAQNTDFIDDKLQEQKTAELVAALEERYGKHPDLPSLLQTAGLMTSFAPEDVSNPNVIDEMNAYAASATFGDVEYTMNNLNTINTAEAKLRQGDIDGYYEEINKIDPYGNLALDVRQQLTPSGVIAEDYYRDTLRKEGFTEQQIDDFWARDTRALAFADLAARKAEFQQYDLAPDDIYSFDGILKEDQIALYHEDAMQDRYDNWTGKVPYEALGRWMATTPEARVQLANDMVALARSGDQVAQDWVDEVIGDWDTVFSMVMNPREITSTWSESIDLFVPGIGSLVRNQWNAIFGDDDPQPKASRP